MTLNGVMTTDARYLCGSSATCGVVLFSAFFSQTLKRFATELLLDWFVQWFQPTYAFMRSVVLSVLL